jgi:hypothetical protein
MLLKYWNAPLLKYYTSNWYSCVLVRLSMWFMASYLGHFPWLFNVSHSMKSSLMCIESVVSPINLIHYVTSCHTGSWRDFKNYIHLILFIPHPPTQVTAERLLVSEQSRHQWRHHKLKSSIRIQCARPQHPSNDHTPYYAVYNLVCSVEAGTQDTHLHIGKERTLHTSHHG